MSKAVSNFLIIAVFLGAMSSPVWATEWSAWFSIGDDVSVSYTQVKKDTWTWKFRNDGDTTITYMTFKYTDKDGDHDDILPGSLKPGAVIGGWAAFTASSRPTITIKEIKRK